MQQPLRVLVCGGRFYDNWEFLRDKLDEFARSHPVGAILSGVAPGADTMARVWADKRAIPFMGYPADWGVYGRSAGFIRNRQMLDEGKPHVVIAFPGGGGTAHMVKLAKGAENVHVIEYPRVQLINQRDNVHQL